MVQGFFVGMVANLIPLPGGVGAVDAGLIGTFVIFGCPAATVFAAVLVYRLIAFWLPIPPGIVAFFQLRRTVAAGRPSGGTAGRRMERRDRCPRTSPLLQKVKYSSRLTCRGRDEEKSDESEQKSRT